MSSPFLSEEWFLSARAIADKYAGQIPDVPVKVKVNQVISGVPFGSGEVRTFIDTTSGQLVMEQGEVDAADVTVSTDYATARALFVDQDQQAAMQAFMSGKVRIQGDMAKLMLLQAAPPSELAKQAAAELRDATAT